jgi:multicomponent Na+:H+ antiporter subunit B
MKRIVAGLLAFLLLLIFFSVLDTDGTYDGIPSFGKVNLQERVSARYISKSVNSQEEQIIRYGETKDPESGEANIVTSVVVNYRSFDTLGEVTVLFLSAAGVGFFLGFGLKRQSSSVPINPIVKLASQLIVPILAVFGAYIFIHGHLTPGGGFPGGTIIATIALLTLLVDDKKLLSPFLKVFEGLAGLMYVGIGVIGLLVAGSFLQNFLPTGTVGNLLSSGVIPIVYSIIGIKVGAELSGVIGDFFSEGGAK